MPHKQKESDTELAIDLLKRHESLNSERMVWDGANREIARFVMPRHGNVGTQSDVPSMSDAQALFDSTAIRANQTLANGMLSWMTPHESRWFAYDAPDEMQGNDDADQYFKKCTEIAHAFLAKSNFYNEIHEGYLNRGAFGTALLYVEEGKTSPLLFQSWNVGTFAIAENDEGIVDTVFREFELTARNAVAKFGEENVSPGLLKDSQEEKEKDKKHTFVHAIYPRDPGEIDPRKLDGENMPIASVYIEKKSRKLVKVSGYREMPAFVTRYLKWGDSVYGWSPSWMALPDARQLNFIEKNMDALAELAAFPRFLFPSGFEGDVDVRAGGVTYYDEHNPNAIPREWATQGRYDIGKDRADIKREAIEKAYHVDLFRMFAQLDKQMTAREVAERSSEKLIQFSPTFARMTTELYNPLLQRVWALLQRAGVFPPPPESVILQDDNGFFLPEPKVSYSSRIALAIKSLENSAFARTMELMAPIAQMRPDILDNYDFDRIARDGARNDGLPAEWLVDSDIVAEIRAARAQQAQQAQEMEQAGQLAAAAEKAGKVPPGSAVGQMMEGMF